MRFLRSVTGYTRLDKIRSEVIRKELEISGIQDLRLKYKQNWIIHLERMDNTRLPKHALNDKHRGRRDRGRPRKRWQCVDAGTGRTTYFMEEDDDVHTVYNVLHFLLFTNCRTLHCVFHQHIPCSYAFRWLSTPHSRRCSSFTVNVMFIGPCIILIVE